MVCDVTLSFGATRYHVVQPDLVAACMYAAKLRHERDGSLGREVYIVVDWGIEGPPGLSWWQGTRVLADHAICGNCQNGLARLLQNSDSILAL